MDMHDNATGMLFLALKDIKKVFLPFDQGTLSKPHSYSGPMENLASELKFEDGTLWRLFTTRFMPSYQRAPGFEDKSLRIISKSSLSNAPLIVSFTVPEAMQYFSHLVSKAEAVLKEEKLDIKDSHRLVSLTSSWQNDLLEGRGKIPLPVQLNYIRLGLSYDDIHMCEKYNLTPEEINDYKDIPISYFEALMEDRKRVTKHTPWKRNF